MKVSLKTLLSVLMLASVSVPLGALARGHHGKAPIKPFSHIGEPTIEAVTATSITITHDKDAAPPQDTGKKGKEEKQKPTEAITKTYLLSNLTSIEVNGEPATVNDLKVGMGVEVSADPPDGLDNTDPSNGGTARSIVAHDVPAK
jgi:hypothetical protein